MSLSPWNFVAFSWIILKVSRWRSLYRWSPHSSFCSSHTETSTVYSCDLHFWNVWDEVTSQKWLQCYISIITVMQIPHLKVPWGFCCHIFSTQQKDPAVLPLECLFTLFVSSFTLVSHLLSFQPVGADAGEHSGPCSEAAGPPAQRGWVRPLQDSGVAQYAQLVLWASAPQVSPQGLLQTQPQQTGTKQSSLSLLAVCLDKVMYLISAYVLYWRSIPAIIRWRVGKQKWFTVPPPFNYYYKARAQSAGVLFVSTNIKHLRCFNMYNPYFCRGRYMRRCLRKRQTDTVIFLGWPESWLETASPWCWEEAEPGNINIWV